MTTPRGTTVTVAVTLCAEHAVDPYLVVHGTRGRITLHYTTGRVRLESGGVDTSTEHPATDLLENLVVHSRDPAEPLLVPLAATRSFTEVVEAIRVAPDPVVVADEHHRVDRSGPHPRRVVPGVDALVARSAAELALFSELDAAWASGVQRVARRV